MEQILYSLKFPHLMNTGQATLVILAKILTHSGKNVIKNISSGDGIEAHATLKTSGLIIWVSQNP